MVTKSGIDWILSVAWSEHFWLPEGVSWQDLKSNSTVQYPQFYEMSYSIATAAILLVLRLLCESFIFLPIGYGFGWMSRKQSLCMRIGYHLRNGFTSNISKFKRVAETAWRFTFYTLIWIYGLIVLKDKPQYGDIDECWRNWPNHSISSDVWWYFVIETGFYWALLFSTFAIDVKRSDFWQMMLHHLVTIVLLSVSWTCNFVRIGSLVLLCHDTADILLELGKLFRYAKWTKAVTGIFIVFLFTWIGTRLVYFPLYIIHPLLIKAPEFIQKSYRWENFFQRPVMPRVIFAMLCILLVLHFFWTYILLKIAVKSVKSGVDDIRENSDSEDTDTSTEFHEKDD